MKIYAKNLENEVLELQKDSIKILHRIKQIKYLILNNL